MVPVPEPLVIEAMRLIAAWADGRAKPASAHAIATGGEIDPHLAEVDTALVERIWRESWPGGVQQRAWAALAEEPGRQFTHRQLAAKLGLRGRRELPGALGAYARRARYRYDGKRPHRLRRDERGVWWLWMDEQVAAVVRRLAGAH